MDGFINYITYMNRFNYSSDLVLFAPYSWLQRSSEEVELESLVMAFL